ncbi:MAG: hypothetical protein HW390_879 [Candidatus Brocadiaceae bacterium]|nr:hypothetical protein [Candidatus Brocadiaceae bacterium]
MIFSNKMYKLLFISGVMSLGLYGCGSLGKVDHADEKPPYYHGHVENEPPARHQQMHTHEAPAPKAAPTPAPLTSDLCTATAAYPSNDKACGSVIYVEKIGPCGGGVGREYCYTIKVTNLTKGDVIDVEVIHSLPKNFQLKSALPEMQKGSTQDVAKWFLGDFHASQTKEIRVCGIPTKSGRMPFCTRVTYNLPDLCLDPIITEAMLALVKRAPAEVLLCDVIPVTFVVTNTGTGIANNVKIKETLPEGLETEDGKTDVTLDVGALKPGESKEVTLRLKAEKTGEFKNTAVAVAEGNLKVESNTTTTSVKQAKLTITKVGPERVYLGRNITYSIEVTNKGDGLAADTVIEDTLPAGVTLVNASKDATTVGNVVTWKVGALRPQESKNVNLTVTPKGIGTVKNSAMTKAVCAAPASVSLPTSVEGIPAILLEVIDIEDPIEVGSNETYEIDVTNQGSDTGTNIKLVCKLEKEMQYVSSSGPTVGTVSADGRTVTFAPLPTLASKAKATWKVVVKALEEGDIRFGVEMTEDCLKRPVDETEATNFYK